MQPFISFIIPVFNCSGGLRRCVDSILQIGTEAIEIILVDDCSTDETPTVCDELSQKNDNIHVIHMPENGGAGMAREAGMVFSRGEYLFFVDSDDRINSSSVRKLLEKREAWQGTDLLCFNYLIDCGDYNREASIYLPEGSVTTDAFLERLSQFRPCTVWQWVFRRELILLNNIHFLPLVSGEDCTFVCQAILWADRIYVYPELLYCYTCIPNSGALSQNIDFIQTALVVKAIWETILPIAKTCSHTRQRQRMMQRFIHTKLTELATYPIEQFDEIAMEMEGVSAYSIEKTLTKFDAIAVVRRHWSAIWSRVQEKTEKFNRPVFICPAGKCTARLAEKVLASGGDLKGFLDNHRTGCCEFKIKGHLVNMPICSFKILSSFEKKPFMIVFSPSDGAESICRQLQGMGYSEDADFICV